MDIDRACKVAQVMTAYLALPRTFDPLDAMDFFSGLSRRLRSEIVGLMKMREQEEELVLLLEKN